MSNKSLADELIRLFVHRDNVYAEQNKKNKYKPIHKPITNELIQQHLKGEITIGAYSLAEDNTAKFLGFDIDNHEGDEEYTDWKKISSKILRYLWNKHKLPTYVEMSGSPGSVHLYVFLEPTDAKKVREFGKHVLKKLKIKDVEIFPKNDKLKGKKLGNLLKLPLGFHQSAERWSKMLFPPVGEPLYRHQSRDGDEVFYLKAIDVHKLPELDETSTIKPINVKTSTIHEKYNKHEELSNSVKSELESKLTSCKTCIQIAYNAGMQLDGEEGHNFRLAICRDLIVKKLSNYQIHEFFKQQFDYNYAITQKNIIEVQTTIQNYNMEHGKKNRYSRCDTMKDKCGTLIKPLCDSCEIKRKINSNINHGSSIISILKMERYNFIRESLQILKQFGEMSTDGKFLHIHRDEISEHLPQNTNVDEFLEIFRNNNLIEESRIVYKGGRRRIIKIKVKSI